MRNVSQTDATGEFVLPFLNVLLSFGGKKSHTIFPILFQDFVRIVAYVSSLALWRQSGCCKLDA